MIPVLILFLVGLMVLAGGFGSWVLFGLMIWGVLWLLFGGRRRYRHRVRYKKKWRQWEAAMSQAQAPPAPGPKPIAPPPQPVVDLKRLPPEVEKKVDRIRRKAAVLGQHPERFPIGSKDLYVVQHTTSDYLPSTVNAYLEVPTWSVTTPTADGRTPLQMLESQLEILETKLDEIAEGVRKQRVDNLLANERFLEQNFGKDEAELTIPR